MCMTDIEISFNPFVPKKRVIGITGGIGSGKSVVSRILRCNGYSVYDCDSRAKALMMTDTTVVSALKNLLGDSLYFKDGSLDRQYLSNILFNDIDIRNTVNGIVHKAVRHDINKNLNNRQGVCFIESAIPITGGLLPFFDEIWVVSAPLPVRLKRIESRDGLTVHEIKKRIESQRDELSQLPDNLVRKLENDDSTSLLFKILTLLN